MEKFVKFTVVKFEPSEILLRDPVSHKIFRYEEPIDYNNVDEFKSDDPIFIDTEPLGPGFIYEKQLTTLGKELAKRSSMQQKQYFSELQISNTFYPIIEFIRKGTHYGAFSTNAILIDQQGAIRLKSPALKESGNIYFENDLQAISLVILQATLLKPVKQLLLLISCKKQLISELTKLGFSVQFIVSIWILLNKIDPLLNFVFNHSNAILSQHFRLLVQEVKSIQLMNKSEYLRNFKIQLNGENSKKPKVQLQITPKKSPICIPPLNLRHKPQNQILKVQRKIELSSKKQTSHNENHNEEARSIAKKKQDKSKILDDKNLTNQMKMKKHSTLSSPQKKKGKTVEKRNELKL